MVIPALSAYLTAGTTPTLIFRSPSLEFLLLLYIEHLRYPRKRIHRPRPLLRQPNLLATTICHKWNLILKPHLFSRLIMISSSARNYGIFFATLPLFAALTDAFPVFASSTNDIKRL